MDIGRLVVKLDADMSGFENSLSEAERAMGRVGSRLQSAGQALALGVTLPILGVGAAAVHMSARAEESANKFDVVMGSAAGNVRAQFAALHDTIPLTTAQMEGLAAGIQDMLVPMGLAREEGAQLSAAAVKMAADIGSFNDANPADVLNAMKSALAGQSEPMRQFGVDTSVAALKAIALQEGLIGMGDELTNSARAQAVMIAIARDTTDALDDAAETAGSAANSFLYLQRDAKELAQSFGDILIPVVTPLVQKLSSVMQWVNDLSPGMKRLVVVVAAVAAALGPLLIAIGTFMVALPTLTAAVGVLGTALAAIASPIGLMIAAVIAARMAWAIWGDEVKAIIANTVGRVREWLVDKFGEIVNRVIEKIQWIGDKFAWVYRLIGGTVRKIAGAARDFVLPTKAMAQETGAAASNIEAAAESAKSNLTPALIGAKEQATLLRTEAEGFARVIEGVSTKVVHTADFLAGFLDVALAATERIKLPHEMPTYQAPQVLMDQAAENAAAATTSAFKGALDPAAARIGQVFNETAERLREGAERLATGWTQTRQEFRNVGGQTATGAMQMLSGSALSVVSAFGPLALLSQVVKGMFEVLGPAIDAAMEPLVEIGRLLGALLLPVIRAIGSVLKIVAIGFSYLYEWMGKFVEGLGVLIDKLAGWLTDIGDDMKAAGQAMQDAAKAARDGVDAKEKETEAVGEATSALNRLSESATNVVSGFKVALYRFNATAAGGGGGGGTVGTTGGGGTLATPPGPTDIGPGGHVDVGGVTIHTSGDGRETYRRFYEELDKRTRAAQGPARTFFYSLPRPI